MYTRIPSVDKGFRAIWVLLWTNSTFLLKRVGKIGGFALNSRPLACFHAPKSGSAGLEQERGEGDEDKFNPRCARHPMLSRSNQACHDAQAHANNGEELHILSRPGFDAMGPRAHDMRGDASPRCQRRWRFCQPRGCHQGSENMQGHMEVSIQSRHATKLTLRPLPSPPDMTITPYQPVVRFADVDAYGIVHNAVYLVYMEEARIHWWRQVVQEAWNWHKVGVLVAHHDIDYKRPLKFQDQPSIACHVAGVGDKSIEVGYRIECDGDLVAEARTVLVCFDHEKQRTTSVPDAWKEAFARAAQ